MIHIKKEIRYLLQKRDSDVQKISAEKKRLAEQGCLVVTLIEGEEPAQNGVSEILRSHAGRGKTS